MAIKWVDSLEIAIALIEIYPDQDPVQIRFTDLRDKVLALHEFDDEPTHCRERILEAFSSVGLQRCNSNPLLIICLKMLATAGFFVFRKDKNE